MLPSSNLSNGLDKLVQRIGQTCLMNWTDVSNGLDRRVQWSLSRLVTIRMTIDYHSYDR